MLQTSRDRHGNSRDVCLLCYNCPISHLNPTAPPADTCVHLPVPYSSRHQPYPQVFVSPGVLAIFFPITLCNRS